MRPIKELVDATKRNTSQRVPTIAAARAPGDLLELVYDPVNSTTAFVQADQGTWKIVPEHPLPSGRILVPYSPENNLVKNKVILFPSHPEEYGTEAELVGEIQSFIHKYVDVSPRFERISAYYVLLSWLFDRFHELPYLRVRGEPGCGKTRFLQTVGSICYRPIFASGASTVSPLFRMMDIFRGTLVIDESDLRVSDEKAEIVKIFNNGNVEGFPVLRCEASANGKEFNPRAYHVFGPKIVASRHAFDDRALESRFITEELSNRSVREDVPVSLPRAHADEALTLRNNLLLFRIRNHATATVDERLVDRRIELRINQIFVPLMSVVSDPVVRTDLQELARSYHREVVADRGMDIEAQVLESVRDLWTSPTHSLPLARIVADVALRCAADLTRPVTSRWIGHLLRTRLHLRTEKSNGVFGIPPSEYDKLAPLCARYGVARSPEVHSPQNISLNEATPSLFGPWGEVHSELHSGGEVHSEVHLETT